jgi:hypothetical protein
MQEIFMRRVFAKNKNIAKMGDALLRESMFKKPMQRFFISNHTKQEKIKTAALIEDPTNSEEAYYKGLGMKKLGKEYEGHALASFKLAVEFGNKKYGTLSKKEINAIETQYKNPMQIKI